jgi:hypothetical protein
MIQFGIEYIYMWKCHNQTPCTVAILYKQKCLFFFKQKMENSKTKQVLSGLVPVGGGGYEERCRSECGGNITYSCMKMEK